MDHLWHKKWAVRSCFIRRAQYLALFILVSGLWVLIPCAAIGGRYLQGWERWVTACSLQRLLRAYWNRGMGPGVGLGDPAGLGPQHRRAVLLALVLDGRLQRCKRGQESATCSQQHCQGLQRSSRPWDGSNTTDSYAANSRGTGDAAHGSTWRIHGQTGHTLRTVLCMDWAQHSMLMWRTASLTYTVRRLKCLPFIAYIIAFIFFEIAQIHHIL